jgi:aspartate/methionine/tyrosine aminotransferase
LWSEGGAAYSDTARFRNKQDLDVLDMIFPQLAPRTSGQAVEPFHAISIAQMGYARAASGLPVYHMEFGQPSCGAPPEAIAAAHAVLDRDPMGYWESAPLRQRLMRHYAQNYGVTLAQDRVLITMGASAALTVAFTALFRPGDSVALVRPGYSPYRNSLRALNLVPHEVRCDEDSGYQITPAHVEALPDAVRGLVIASPANPTGTMIDGDALKQIVNICAVRRITLISDEIYHGLAFARAQHSALEFGDQPVIVSSFSKYYGMAGWRLGWLIVPDHLADAISDYRENLFLTAPSLAQHAALAAMDATETLDRNALVYAKNRAFLLEALPALGISRFAPPDGAFYIYADIGHLTQDSYGFCARLVEETGVCIAPGIDFDPEHGNRFIRISFAVNEGQVRDAIGIFGDWLNR